MNEKIFPSKYPIMCAVMNGVSNVDLALAVTNAGCMASLMSHRDTVESDIKQFLNSSNSNHIVLSVPLQSLLDKKYLDFLLSSSLEFIEVMRDDVNSVTSALDAKENPESGPWLNLEIIRALEKLKNKNFKILRRALDKPVSNVNGLIDGICLKGQESAGSFGKLSIIDLLELQKHKTPSTHLITYGGVSGPDQVHYYLKSGASAVAVGTLFAATKESCLDETVVKKIITSTSKDLSILPGVGHSALIIDKKANHTQIDENDWNRQNKLSDGIAGRGGLIYASASIEGITEYRTVQEVVDFLVQKI